MLDHSELIKQLSADKACTPALLSARSMSVPQLLDLYVKNIDYGIRSNLLTPEFIRDNASESDLSNSGIFIGSKSRFINAKTLVLLGRGNVKSLHSGYDVSRIYTAQSNKLIADVTGNANVVIEAYGNSIIEVHQYEKAHVMVILHDQSTCTHFGKITVKNGRAIHN